MFEGLSELLRKEVDVDDAGIAQVDEGSLYLMLVVSSEDVVVYLFAAE